MTLAERLAEISAAPGVALSRISATPYSVTGWLNGLWGANIEYVETDGESANVNSIKLVGVWPYVEGGDPASGSWYWSRGRVPSVIPDAAPVYFSARTSGTPTEITAAMIETFCNETWGSLHSGAPSIRQFQVSPISSDTVRISGDFNTGNGSWSNAIYYVRLIDPNGSVAVGDANIKFELVN